MISVGVDGCKAGWYFVRLEAGLRSGGVCDTFQGLLDLHHDADLILVDIPIGLRGEERDERLCDRTARKVLGSRSSSVFPVPSRAALTAADYEASSRLNYELTGRKLSKQSWALIPRIREVDLALRARGGVGVTVREAHPEICFWAFGNRVPMRHSKKLPEGVNERYELLKWVYPETDRVVSELASELPPGVGRDDFLDAFAAAVTGVLSGGLLRTLPDEPEIDGFGLAMEMVFHES